MGLGWLTHLTPLAFKNIKSIVKILKPFQPTPTPSHPPNQALRLKMIMEILTCGYLVKCNVHTLVKEKKAFYFYFHVHYVVFTFIIDLNFILSSTEKLPKLDLKTDFHLYRDDYRISIVQWTPKGKKRKKKIKKR